jgi:hypothetical protein
MLVASLVALGVCLGGENLHAQAATPCTYYVSPSGNDNSTGKTLSTAFATLQAAHDYIFKYDTTLAKKPINVCVEAGTYYASDFSQAQQNDYNNTANNQYPDAEYASTNASVLNVYLSGGPNAYVTFEADPTTNPYVLLVSSGWNGINFAPYNGYGQLPKTYVPHYVTVNGFNVQGEGSLIEGDFNAPNPLKTYALSRTNNPAPQGFFDGNCIGVNGAAQGTNPVWGIPSHITISNNVVTNCVGGGIAAAQADYVNITGNTVAYCSWWSIYGTSGISLFHSIDSDGTTGITKNYVTGNWVTENYENVPWVGAGAITDGEGIIIDSNLNSVYVTTPPQYSNGVNVPAYASRTLVANNVIWGNGSSAIEVFQSQHVDVEANSTYANVSEQTPATNFQGRGELSLNQIADVNVANNVFESVAPSESGPTTSYPLCAANITTASPNGYVWFENNVYYAGPGQTVSFHTSGPACQTDSTKRQAFYEGVNEQWNLNPLYENTSTSGWPPRVDLGVQDSTTAKNGCWNGGICYAPTNPNADILSKPRVPPYASGAYAQPYE